MSLGFIAVVLASSLVAAEPRAPDNAAVVVSVDMVAVRATKEDRPSTYFEKGLERIKEAVAELSFDTYRMIKASRAKAESGKETVLPIDATYSLSVQPLSRDTKGRIRLRVRVQKVPRGLRRDPVNVLESTVVAVPGDQFKVGGLRLDKGELVIILSAAVANDNRTAP